MMPGSFSSIDYHSNKFLSDRKAFQHSASTVVIENRHFESILEFEHPNAELHLQLDDLSFSSVLVTIALGGLFKG